MSNLQISTFNFKSFPVRVEIIKNEPYFALKDVCIILGLKVASPERFSLDPQGVTLNVIPTNSGKQELTFINEPNLYRIIFKSRKTEAVEFQNWVFEEVLPQIRKTGQYSQNQQQNLPLVEEKKYTFEHTKEQGLRLVSLWHSAYRMAKILGELEPALSMLGSTFAPMAHSCSKEYQITLTLAHKELTRMLDGVEVSPRENAHFYKVLSDLRQWQPKGFLRKIS